MAVFSALKNRGKKKAVAKKSAAKKKPVKKAPAKKVVAKKTPAKKAPAKKVVPKKIELKKDLTAKDVQAIVDAKTIANGIGNARIRQKGPRHRQARQTYGFGTLPAKRCCHSRHGNQRKPIGGSRSQPS